MAWRGFTEESKLYWGYPGRNKTYRPNWRWRQLTPEEKRRAVRFWLFYSRAWFRFFVLIPLGATLRRWRYRVDEWQRQIR